MKTTCLLLFIGILWACQPANSAEQAAAASSAAVDPHQDTLPASNGTDWLQIAKEKGYTTDDVMGLFEPAKHPDFVLVPSQYCDREGLYLRKETYEAFLKMHAAAKADGIQLVVRSATRNFNYQKRIWEGKWNGQRKIAGNQNAAKAYPDPVQRALKILEYSSMPGSSRHHWGTDLDLNAFNNEWFEKGIGKKTYDWLSQHASNYGFCQPYSPKGTERPFGYNEEKWHWSYLPLAQALTALAEDQLKNDMIKGFDGANTATEIDVVTKYVLGINTLCQP
jgi:D-alanyl-D-alanine carboxypeptidase